MCFGVVRFGMSFYFRANGEPNGDTGGPGDCATHGGELASYEWDCNRVEWSMCQFSKFEVHATKRSMKDLHSYLYD